MINQSYVQFLTTNPFNFGKITYNSYNFLISENYLKYSKCIKIKILAFDIYNILLLKMEAQLLPQNIALLSSS